MLQQDKDLEIDADYTTRLISVSGGFSTDVRDNIVSHPLVVKNRVDPVQSVHISSESRQVMRKGFDLGVSSPGLRMLYDVRTTCSAFRFYLLFLVAPPLAHCCEEARLK